MSRWRDKLLVCSSYYRETPREARMAVVARVADQHRVTVADIMGTSRAQPYAAARHAAMRAVYAEFADSASAVGRFFGRDHTTVMYALRKGVA